MHTQQLAHVCPNSTTDSVNGEHRQADRKCNVNELEADEMAYANTTHAAHSGLGDRLGMLVKAVKEALAQRRVFNQTVRELNALTQRELADLGIHRSMITRIATEAAYGK
ncbi:DUF1127 domain-containing protein [Cereibacter changlensis]|uniref:DUF1127 domain-containing protein n=1 Tax=Cereibacter changlensis TaxID=402884 RepID=UPI0031F6D1A9